LWAIRLFDECHKEEGFEAFVLFLALSFFMSTLLDDSPGKYFIFKLYLPITSLFSEMIRRARTTRVGKKRDGTISHARYIIFHTLT